MTAEIAILNRSAVALAADSAVTAKEKDSLKIYNTVNKLFTLSKHHPVGIMIYGSANIMGVPWETIIKIFRQKLRDKRYDTLDEYAESLITFLDNNNSLFPTELQDEYSKYSIQKCLLHVEEQIDKKVKQKTEEPAKLNENDLRAITTEIIHSNFEQFESSESLKHLPRNFSTTITQKYKDFISTEIKRIFEKLPITSESRKKLVKIAGHYFSKKIFSANYSGIVIAGFGDKDIFPVLKSYKIEAIYNKRLKYQYTEDERARITFNTSAQIIPFAQRDNVHTFVEGIDPKCMDVIFGFLNELLTHYPRNIVDSLKLENEDEKEQLISKLNKISRTVLEDFDRNIKQYIQDKNIYPIVRAVNFLPIDELASMAESLVNLTSFKQKISMDSETVGGPIDVAVISKGDGFVWIKRKHYFKPELNPHYLTKYFDKNDKESHNENSNGEP